MSGTCRKRIIAAAILMLLPTLSRARLTKNQAWLGRTGEPISREVLANDIDQHERWLDSNFKNGRPILYYGVDLSGVDLSDHDLRKATFSSYYTLKSDGSTIAHITSLRGADLSRTELEGAIIREADVFGVIFEPLSNPYARYLATAENLEFLNYRRDPSALVLLRKEFENNGFRDQERKITYALRRREAELSWEACRSRELTDGKVRPIIWSSNGWVANCGSFFLNRVFFDWTCQYGMNPGRPLQIGLALWGVFSLLYFTCLNMSSESGLYRVQVRDLERDPNSQKDIKQIRVVSLPTTAHCRVFRSLGREVHALGTAMFFSLMSAFNIGFRDMDFGRWLRLITREPFDIKATGWARVVAGWQSLISLLLVALWLLTYFGRPFE